MEINSATIATKNFVSSKNVSAEFECLSLDNLEGTANNSNSGRKVKRKFSNLSLNTTKEKTVKSKLQEYNIKDHFDIVETLGMGTYAYVRHAVDNKTGKHVAIKTSRGATSCGMLKNEYNLLKRLADDNIVKVFDFSEDESKMESYLIMEYFKGKSLDQFVEDNSSLNEEEAKFILHQLISSVRSLHELGIAHRDIKPENILLNDEKEVKLIDFNISKANSGSSVSENESKFTSVFHTQISSPLYCAPEIKENSCYTESVDIWGIGIVLFTMLFGSLKSH
jgi:serine/threonine protein kinase